MCALSLFPVAPNTAPMVTTAYAADSRTVALQWDPPLPEDHNGIIREYRVNVTSLDNGDHVQVAALGTTTIIGSLTPSFTYTFTVTAFTVAEGPYSQVQTITMPPDGWYMALVSVCIVRLTCIT